MAYSRNGKPRSTFHNPLARTCHNLAVLVALGLLLLAQCLYSLRKVWRWRRYIRSSIAASAASFEPAYAPPATVIVPCRGTEPGLAENLAAYASQDYPDCELILVTSGVTSGAADPASEVAASISGARVIHAVARPDESDKVTKLRAAVRQARPGSRVLAFADSDARPGRCWLRNLVRPLADDSVAVATGYRWFVVARAAFLTSGLTSGPPRERDRQDAHAELLPSPLPLLLRAVWNSFIASLLGDHARNFCWGGSMALRRDTFDRLRVDDYWQGAASDDYQLTRAARDAGLRIQFVPACLVTSPLSCAEGSWRELLSWTTRQIIITRVYAPSLWWLGFISNAFYALAAAVLIAALPSVAAAVILGAIIAAGMATGAQRLSGAIAALPEAAGDLRGQRWAYLLLTPVVPLLLLYNFISAGFTREFSWRGFRYRLDAPQRTMMLAEDPAGDPGQRSQVAAATPRERGF